MGISRLKDGEALREAAALATDGGRRERQQVESSTVSRGCEAPRPAWMGIIGDSLRNSVLKICRDPGIHGDYGCVMDVMRSSEGRRAERIAV